MKGLFQLFLGRKRRQQVWAATLRRNMQRALEEGRYAFALKYCQELLEVAPRDVEAWLLRGHLAWKHEKNEALAVACYRNVLILGGYDSSNASVAKARACLAQLLAPEP